MLITRTRRSRSEETIRVVRIPVLRLSMFTISIFNPSIRLQQRYKRMRLNSEIVPKPALLSFNHFINCIIYITECLWTFHKYSRDIYYVILGRILSSSSTRRSNWYKYKYFIYLIYSTKFNFFDVFVFVLFFSLYLYLFYNISIFFQKLLYNKVLIF